ncbi:transcriptional regulator [Mycobacterium sp. JS623]|uniref:TetR/AcrR family transcriptional regulator C-terminal domain-containing protein n=1 Tax=Mycobacterium sp. JS623 TaxID=212767 RepID=UPI0002A55CD7|nr:TetR/AcrR family transcriptional regulator C-terminal domain-containing protein [Mycobacterium sp. JS623]AGB25783.1 transcriptional regulator [Mycobacterium sp. JS623]
MPPDRIVAAALALVDADGAEALSMRTLAQQLNSGTATLYRHFTNRSALVADVVDYVFGEVHLDADELATRSWQQACETVVHRMYAALKRHPNVTRLMLEQIPLGPNALAIREACLAMLLASGFTADMSARIYATLARYVLGFAIQYSGHPDSHAAKDADAFRDVDPSRFPATLAVADAMPIPLEVEFSFGLDLLIKGLSQIH